MGNRLFTVAFLAAILGGSAAGANEYIRTSTADWFQYEDSKGALIESKIDAVDGGWRLWNPFAGLGPTWVYTSPDHDWFWVWNGTTYQLVANLSGSVGSYRYANIAGCNRGTVRVAWRGAFTVPAGSFPDVTRLDFSGTCADRGITAAWFARGEGVVAWTETTLAGPRTFQLARALIGGKNLPTSAAPPPPASTSASTQAVAPTEHDAIETMLWGANDTYLVTTTYRDAFSALHGSGVKSQVFVATDYVASQVRYEMKAAGVPLDQVEFLVAPLDSIWIRDYGPIVLKRPNGERVVADLDYYYNRRKDDQIPAAYASYRGWSRVAVPLSYEGGNFATDGRGTAFASQGVQWFNQDLSLSQILARFKLLGCDRVTYFEPLADEGTTHIDMFARIMSDTQALVSSYPTGHRQARVTNDAARTLQSMGYSVVRVESHYPHDEYATYANSVLANGIALVPQYGDKTRDQKALDAYRGLGFQAKGIDSRLIIQYGGATHCVTMQIPKGT